MGQKNPRDVISKASWSLLEAIKDTVSANLASALRNQQLVVENKQVEKLTIIVAASIEEGYHKGFKSFSKSVDSVVDAAPVAVPAPKKKQG